MSQSHWDLIKFPSTRGNSPSSEFAVWLICFTGAVLAAIGSVSPWANVSGERFIDDRIERFSVYGTVGDGDATLILALISCFLILWRIVLRRTSSFVPAIAAVLLLVIAVVGMLNWADVSHIPGVYEPGKYFRSGATVGWGLILVTVSSAIAASSLAYQIWRQELR